MKKSFLMSVFILVSCAIQAQSYSPKRPTPPAARPVPMPMPSRPSMPSTPPSKPKPPAVKPPKAKPL